MNISVIPVDALTTLIDETVTKAVAQALAKSQHRMPKLESVTQTQAAQIMGVSRYTVSKLIAAKTLRMDGTGRITMASIEAAMKGDGQ